MDSTILSLDSSGNLNVREIKLPDIQDDEVLVEIKCAGITPKDLQTCLNGKFDDELDFGREASGVIIDVGKAVDNLSKGDRVCITSAIACNDCENCIDDNQHFCNSTSDKANKLSSLFCSVAVLKSINCQILLETIEMESAAILDSISRALSLLQKLNFKEDNAIYLTGFGSNCQDYIILESLKVLGASKIYVIDHHEEVINYLKSNSFENCMTIDSSDSPQSNAVKIKGLSDFESDITILLKNDSNLEEISKQITKTGGIFVKVDNVKDTFQIGEKLEKISVTRKSLTDAMIMVTSEKFDRRNVISHRFDIENAAKGLKMLSIRDDLSKKSLIVFNKEEY